MIWSSWGKAIAALPGSQALLNFFRTPSSANLAALLTDETGSGANVHATSPTITTPTVSGQLTGNIDNSGDSLFLTTYNNTGATAGAMVMRRARGTLASPTATLSGDTIAGINARGYGDNAFSSLGRATFSFTASETWTNSAQGTAFLLETTITGGTTRASRFAISGVGLVSTTTSCFGRGAPVTKTANFTVAVSENWLINNKSGSSCTVTLPAASDFPGREIMFKNSQAQTVVSASSNVVPRVTAAAGTAILASGSGNWCTMVSDGTNWVIMAGS